MSLDKATVARIATLARIRLSDEEVESYQSELNQILGWVEQLAEVDTSDAEPMTGIGGFDAPQRDDVVNDGGYPDRIVRNAPTPQGDFFSVPKVVE